MVKHLAEVKQKLSALKKQHDELLTAYESSRGMTNEEVVRNIDRRGKLETRMRDLNALVCRLEDEESVDDAEIAKALGKSQPSSSAPSVPSLRLPIDIATDESRQAAKAKRKARANFMSATEKKRLNEIWDENSGDALPFIEGIIVDYREIVAEASEEIGRASAKNEIVAYTQGQHSALTFTLSKLWLMFRTSVDFDREQLKLLEKRVAELEARPAFEDAGVWAGTRSYRKGNGVTDHGSYWISKRDTTLGERPGASDAWRLAVKCGRDGKDARV